MGVIKAALRIRRRNRVAKGATGINERERRVLDAIDNDLASSAPDLAVLLATFTVVTAGQAMPARETIRATADAPPSGSNGCAGTSASSISGTATGRWPWRWRGMWRMTGRRWTRWVLSLARLPAALADAIGEIRDFRSRPWGVPPLGAWAGRHDAESINARVLHLAPGADGLTTRPEHDRIEQPPDTVIADRADCGPALPVVRVIMPPTPDRPHETDLLLCGHHYRVSRQALAQAHASVCRLSSPGGTEPTALIPNLPRSPVPVS